MPKADEIDAQLKLIAKMLREARAPLIYGLTQLTVEAQELAVELAMCLRGAIDTPRGSRIPPRGTSLQLHGEARTTMGELQQYYDLWVLVKCEHNPKLLESFTVAGLSSLPAKLCHELEVAASGGTGIAARVRELGCRNRDEVLALREKLKNPTTSERPQEQLLAAWQAAKYPLLIYQPVSLFRSLGKGAANSLIEEIERAVLARSKFGRAAAWPLEDAGAMLSNTAGAEYVLTARTGFPAAVCCLSGCAEYLPGVTNAEAMLADGVIDAALFLGDGPSTDWTAVATQHLQSIPTAIIASKQVLQGQASEYQIVCSPLSEEQGTIVREDGIPLLFSPKTAPEASAEKILRQLLALVREPSLPGAAQ